LSAHAWLADRTKYGSENLTVSVYGLQGLGKSDFPQEIAFGEGLRLASTTVAGGAHGGSSFRAGDLLGVTTKWDVLAPLPSLNFSLRLQDQQGRTWKSADHVPLEGSAPTQNWRPGTTVEDRQGLVLPPDLPPGPYGVLLVLYDPATGVPVRVGESDRATLASIQVSPAAVAPDPASLPISTRVNKRLGDELELLGFSISPQPLLPGQNATLSLWWRANGQPTASYSLRTQAMAPDGTLAFDETQALSRVPSDTWESGQVVREYYDLAVDPATTSGEYRLQLSLAPTDGPASGATLDLGNVAIKARTREYRLPRVSHLANVSLDSSLLLRGYDVTVSQDPDRDVELTLFWQAKRRVPSSYKVFVHLVDASGRIVAQADSVPADGLASTDSWLPGEVVVDKHKLTNVSPGRYHILVGLYDPMTGARLPALDDTGGPIRENAVPLEDIEVP
jgi:hypothetical protein